MQGVRQKSLHATLRLVVLVAVASVVFAAQATAQQQLTTSATVPIATTQIAQSTDEATFKQMLVKNSPWNVEWNNTTFSSSGKFGLSFAVDNDGKLSGQFLGDPKKAAGTPPSPLKDVVLKKNCVNVVNPSGTKFEYCLAGNNTLKGPYSGVSRSGDSFVGEAVAKPARR